MVSSHFSTEPYSVSSAYERNEENVSGSQVPSTSTILSNTDTRSVDNNRNDTGDSNSSATLLETPVQVNNIDIGTLTGCIRSQSGPPSLSISFEDRDLRSTSSSSSTKTRSVNSTNITTGSSNFKQTSEYGEESYEGFGYGRDVELDVEVESPGGGNSSAPSPTTGLHSLGKTSTASPCSTLGRHTWLRTSLKRTPPGSARPTRQLGSNALASQLYRSGSFNSSGRGSTCDATDDMYSDVSLEDDVIDLNHRVKLIQERMDALADTQSVSGERYARVKQENATLQARIIMLEEAAKDAEARAEEKLQSEQRRHREWVGRLEREKELQLENYAMKVQAIEVECSGLREQVARLREQLDSAKEERLRLENLLDDANSATNSAREAEKQAVLRANETRVLLDAAKEELANRAKDRQRIEDLLLEVARLGATNKSLQESQDELQAAIAVHAGRELLMLNSNSLYEDFDKNPQSLAAELSANQNQDQLDGHENGNIAEDKPRTKAEVLQALKEQKEVNAQLRSYIDGILLNIVENNPQLLEVKKQH
ncbi:rab11 family-interacting protein 4 isoform X1 [Microplitis demolitor]|uniref:rab11 family-interacting protein 4 isoform X1 n=1 Tax=Microplitis demolitor TaxID=69319 RepID=UPI0004CCCD15|nr:rab11 family-interacting protein 4 isoform X1 [Microplitis demolitor]